MRGKYHTALIAIIVILVVALAMFWFWLMSATVQFGVKPGGNDVVVEVAGKQLKPRVVSNSGNIYIANLRLGEHELTITKPGYKSQSHTVIVRQPAGDIYPEFPPLEPLVRRKTEKP